MGCKIAELYDLSETIAADLFTGLTYPWEALPLIGGFICRLGETLDPEIFEQRGENIWVARSAKVAPTAYLSGPLIVDEEAEIRHCAFIRGNAIIGKNCVVGNSTELKNSVLFNHVQVPHYNYVGDSILGNYAHMGAGSITSNVKADRTLVVVKDGAAQIQTGLKKFGAMLGDHVEVGCNAVLNPGTVVGRNTNIYPLSMVRGVIPAGSIYKSKNEIAGKILPESVRASEMPAVPEAAGANAAEETDPAGQLREIYDAFIEAMRGQKASETAAEHIGGWLAGSKKKDPLQERFSQNVENAVQVIADADPDSAQAREVLQYMLTVQKGLEKEQKIYLMLLAVQRYAETLVPFLEAADAAELFSMYEKLLPRNERMPVHKQLMMELKKQAHEGCG